MNKRQSKIFIVSLIILLIAIVVAYIIIEMKGEKSTSQPQNTDKVTNLVEESKEKVTKNNTGLLKKGVEREKFYRSKILDAEKKAMNNKNIDKEIEFIQSNIEREQKESYQFENKDNILSGYLSALTSLVEINENNKKDETKSNAFLAKDIDENLMYSKREIYKTELKKEEE